MSKFFIFITFDSQLRNKYFLELSNPEYKNEAPLKICQTVGTIGIDYSLERAQLLVRNHRTIQLNASGTIRCI